jgi:hypothetical protein
VVPLEVIDERECEEMEKKSFSVATVRVNNHLGGMQRLRERITVLLGAITHPLCDRVSDVSL